MRTSNHVHYPARQYGALLGLLVPTVLVLGLLVVLAPWLRGALDPIEQQRQALALEQQRIELEQARALAVQLAPVDHALAVFWRILPAGLAVLALGVGLDAYRQRRRPLIQPDAAGRLPVGRAHLVADARAALVTIEQSQVVQLQQARQQPAPHTLTYSPRISGQARPELPMLPDAATLDTETAPAAANVPTFADLLDQGAIVQGGPLVLGYDAQAGELLRGGWADLLAAAVAGGQGSGKSSTMRFFIAQFALHGARFLVIDPHMHASPEDSLALTLEPLQRAMLCAPAADDGEILQVLELYNRRLDDRLMGRDRDRTPVLLVVDEYTALQRRDTIADALGRAVERGATEGRKVKVYAMIGGQTWGAKRTGGTETRNALQTAYVHRIKKDEARKLLGSDTPADVSHLPTGAAWLQRASGADLALVHMPYCPADAIVHVAALLGFVAGVQAATAATAAASPRALPEQPAVGLLDVEPVEVMEVSPAVMPAAPLPPQQKAVEAPRPELVMLADLMRARANQKEKLSRLFNCTSTAGREYSAAVDQLRTLEQELAERALS